jgi:hypothetical protein
VLARLDEGDRRPLAARPARSDPVDIGVRVRRNVEGSRRGRRCSMSRPRAATSRSRRGRRASHPEAAHHPVALLLRATVEPPASWPQRLPECGRQVVDLAARPGEDEGRGRILHIEETAQRSELVGSLHDVRNLADTGNAVAGVLLRVDRDPDRRLRPVLTCSARLRRCVCAMSAPTKRP